MSKATIFLALAKLTSNQTLRRKYLTNYHRFKMREWMKAGGHI